MLELCPVSIGIVRINAASSAIARIQWTFDNASFWRLSPKEALLLCAPVDEARVLHEVEAHLANLDQGGIALADSDSFAVWKLDGSGAETAFSRVSAIPLPAERPAFVQGLVADAPTKVIVGQSHLLLLIGSPLSHHLRERLLESSASIGIVERAVTTFMPSMEVVT